MYQINEVLHIEKAGGQLIYNRLDGVLAISRAFGDIDLKNKGLISEPHIFKTTIDDSIRYCVIASDWVWDVVNANDVFNICENEKNTDTIVNKIVYMAIEKGSEDNISCIVISFGQENKNKWKKDMKYFLVFFI